MLTHWLRESNKKSYSGDHQIGIINDIKEFVSPIDGSIISSRASLREHERKHGVRQVGDDLKSQGNHGLTREQSIEKQQKGKRS